MDTEGTITQLGEILAQLESTPQDLALIKQQISLTEKLEMLQETINAINSLSQLVMLDAATWLRYFDVYLKAPRDMALDDFVDALEKFDTAEQDYLCERPMSRAEPALEVLQRHVTFIITLRQAIESSEFDIDAEIEAFLSRESCRQLIRAVVGKGGGLLAGSEELWRSWLDWELSLPLDLEQLHQMFLERLSTPHLASDATASLYSSFCSEHCPDEYEARMIEATQVSHTARQKLSGEKRYGKTREDLEQELVSAQDNASKISVFMSYLAWETDERAKHQRNQKAPISDPALIRAVFERYIACLAQAAQNIPDTADYYKAAEAAIWLEYLETEEREGLPLIEVDSAFELALALKTIDPGTPMAELFVARASTGRRLDDDALLDVLYRGLTMVTSGFLNPVLTGGDQSFSLEKFAVEWAEIHDDGIDSVLALLGKPNKARSSSYQVTLLRAGAESRRGLPEAARAIYQSAIQRSDLDWPEAVYESYLRFENQFGSLESLLDAQRRINKEQEKLAKRRQKASQEQMQVYTQAQNVAEPVESAPAPQPEADTKPEGFKRDREHTQVLVTGLQHGVDVGQLENFFSDCGVIREVTIVPGEESDAALVEFRSVDSVPAALARDRRTIDRAEISVTMLWRSTLWVTNIAKDTDDAALRRLFAPYGRILHTRWPSRKYGDTRRFCYVTMESPAAAQSSLQLTGTENSEGFGLVVKISDPSAKAARTDASSLFVGGLSASTTEEDLRELFTKHGTIKRVRLGWDPVKKAHKGFAFVDMESQEEMTAALGLNGIAFNGRILRVSQSDPNHAKKKQPEAESSLAKKAKTVRLHNLPPNTQEGLLQQALEKIVPVQRLELFAKSHEAVAELASAADAGKLLLASEPFLFDGSVIQITEVGKRPEPTQDALSFAPRNARKPKPIGKGRTAPATDKQLPPAFVTASTHGQDDFRQMVTAKNKQREGNLAEATGDKRKVDGEDRPAKRGRVE